MRTFLIAVGASMVLAIPANAATRNFGVTDFTKIRVDLEMRGDTLIVRTASSWGGYPNDNAGPVEVSIGTHELNSALLNGGGSLLIDRVHGLSFALTVQGSGRAEIGSAEIDQMS